MLRVSAMHHPNRACVEQRQDELVVQACGSMALHASERGSPLDAVPGVSRVAWDFSLVTDLDAAGLGAIADAARRATERGGSVYVHAASPVVHRLAALAGLDRIVPGAWATRVAATPLCTAPCPIDGALRR
jgi:anti-anti-sigma factor